MSEEILESATENIEIETPAHAEATSTAGLTVDRRTYRTYGTVTEEGKFKSASGDKPKVSSETADNKAWKASEAAGNTKLSENIFIFYTLEELNAFKELIPDEEQQLYIINRGIATIQTAKANQLQAELTDDEKAFKYSDETIDLRDFLNEAPKRTKLSDTQKLVRDLEALSDDKKAEMLKQLMDMLSAK